MILPSENVIENSQVIRQVLFDAGVEVLGPGEAELLFAQLSDVGEMIVPGLYAAIKGHYGEMCGQGVGLRLGRATFKYGLRAWGQQSGFDTPEFRFQPAPRKVRAILTVLCEHLLKNFGAEASLSEDSQYWYLQVDTCRAGRASAVGPACPILTGLLQEILSWTAGGRFHCVEETVCCAQGAAACQFRIEKKALD